MMFRKIRQPDFSDLLAILADKPDDIAANSVSWRALQRCLMPEGGTIEAIQYPGEGWRAALRVPGLKPTFFEAPDQMAAMVGALLKHHASPAAKA